MDTKSACRPIAKAALRVRTSLAIGTLTTNNSEVFSRARAAKAVSMRRELKTTGARADRLELMVVRTGLRAGRRIRKRSRR